MSRLVASSSAFRSARSIRLSTAACLSASVRAWPPILRRSASQEPRSSLFAIDVAILRSLLPASRCAETVASLAGAESCGTFVMSGDALPQQAGYHRGLRARRRGSMHAKRLKNLRLEGRGGGVTLSVTQSREADLYHCEKGVGVACHTVSRRLIATLPVIGGDAVLLHSPVELLPIPADEACRLRLVAKVAAQRLLDHDLLAGLAGAAVSAPVRSRGRAPRAAADRIGKVIHRDDVAGGQDHETFDGVLELADVARPSVDRQQVIHPRAEPLRGAAVPRTRPQEVRGEERDVLGPGAQRRHLDRDHVQAVVEILAKPPLGHESFEIRVSRRDPADVDAARRVLSQAAHLILLEDSQKLRLGRRGRVGDFIQEKGAAVPLL